MIKKGDKVIVSYLTKGQVYDAEIAVADSDEHQIFGLSYGPHVWVKFQSGSRYELAINGDCIKIEKIV